MRRILFVFFFCLVSVAGAAEKGAGVDFSLTNVTLSQAVTMLWQDVFQRPFVLAPELVTDARPVSFAVQSRQPTRAFVLAWLGSLNVRVITRNGTDFISPQPTPVVPQRPFFYTPKYRSVSYLATVLQNIVGGGTFSTTVNTLDLSGTATAPGVAPDRTATRRLSSADNADILVYLGTGQDIARIRAVLPSVDVPAQQVTVSGYVFEVQTDSRNGSGLQVVANLLHSKFGVSIGADQDKGSNVISLNTGVLSAFYSLIKNDSRFKVVSSPRLTVLSGASSSFSVGEEVPVLGEVSYQGNTNTPVQSVTYRNSGAIFTVQPFIYRSVINLSIEQQLSNFVQTTTGVNNSPTLIKRDVKTQVAMQNGQVLILGGLAESRTTQAHQSLFHFITGDSDQTTKTDIVVMLQAHLS